MAVNELVENDEDDFGDHHEEYDIDDQLDEYRLPSPLRNLAKMVKRGSEDGISEALDDLNYDIDEPVRDGYSALHLAIMYGHLECVELLLSRGASLEVDVDGVSPLHSACGDKGFDEMAKLLLQSAEDPEHVNRMLEAVDGNGDTPLHYAAEADHEDVIKLLLEEGASRTQKNYSGMTPFDKAKPGSEARRILEDAAPEYYSVPETPPDLQKLAAVVGSGKADALRHALDDSNHSIDEPLHKKYSALHLAVMNGNLPCVQLLLSKGASLEVNAEGDIPLHYACYAGFTEIAQLLLQRAENPECTKRMVEAVDMNGDTSLHFAARNDHVDIIRLLLGAGASPTKTNNLGKTPTDIAKPESEARKILEAQLLLGL